MIDKRVATVEDALAGLADGAVVMTSGFGESGVPIALIQALEKTGVGGLTMIQNGLRLLETSAPLLFSERRVRKVICSSARGRGAEPTLFEQQFRSGELELELVPQGTFAERMRAAGCGIPAFYTPTGVGTSLTEGKEVREFNGRKCVLEHALHADFALIRADKADRWGNVSFRGTQENFAPVMAMAARTTVVEVTTLSDEPLPLDTIGIPGIFVHRVIQLPDLRQL